MSVAQWNIITTTAIKDHLENKTCTTFTGTRSQLLTMLTTKFATIATTLEQDPDVSVACIFRTELKSNQLLMRGVHTVTRTIDEPLYVGVSDSRGRVTKLSPVGSISQSKEYVLQTSIKAVKV